MNHPLDTEDRAWLSEYESAVVALFSAKFKEGADRFTVGNRLLDRFVASVEEVRKRGRGFFHAVDEAHNELCIAAALLKNVEPQFVRILYEPPLHNTDKTIDFCAEIHGGPLVYVDVKTIKPRPKDRWDQYERAMKEGWFPKDVAFVVEREWLGGELWHDAFAARARMLEYTIEFEQKIAQAQLAMNGNVSVLALCGEGFHWYQDELEDFVAFYRTGHHRKDDPFSVVEDNYIGERHLSLSRAVSRIACLRRPQGELLQKRLNWNVQPPREPAF
jgi:hypothetical protein